MYRLRFHSASSRLAFRPLMEGKLTEMDDVVASLFEQLAALDAACSGPACRPSLLVVCSDHGMTDVRHRRPGRPFAHAPAVLTPCLAR
jgi:hypothetical protein